MLTTASKQFYLFGLVAVAAAAAYGWSTGGNGLGPLSFGFKDSVGDHLGYTILMMAAGASFFAGGVVTAVRDADPKSQAEVAGTTLAPPATPVGPSYWPVLGAFAAVTTATGLVVSNILFVGGLIFGGLIMVEWLISAWSDRATGDPAANREIRNKMMYPIEIPVLGAAGVAVMVLAISRVLLTVSKENAVWVALIAAIVVLGGGIMVAYRKFTPNVIAALLVVFGAGVITVGILGGVQGEREFHPAEGGEDHGVESGAVVNPSTEANSHEDGE